MTSQPRVPVPLWFVTNLGFKAQDSEIIIPWDVPSRTQSVFFFFFFKLKAPFSTLRSGGIKEQTASG